MSAAGVERYSLRGRVAVVTGSGRNIGRAIAIAFARCGAAVVVNGSRDAAALDAVVAEIRADGGEAVAMLADIGVPSAAQALAARAADAFGTVDVVVFNAGLRPLRPLLEATLDDWERTMAVNATSAFVLARATLPGMVERGFGRFIGLSGLPIFTGRYGGKIPSLASKAALQGLCKGLADEFGHAGVTANVLAPGTVDTERDWSNYPTLDAARLRREIPAGRIGTVDDLASACVYLASDAASFVNGQTLHLNGGQVMY